MPNTVATAAIMRRLTRRGSRSMCQLSAVFLPRSTAGPGRRRRKSADSSHVMRTSPTGWRVLSPPAGNSSQRVCMRVRSPGLLDVESTRKVRLLSVPVIRVSAEDPRIADYRNVPDPQLLASRGIFVAEGRHVVRRLLTASRFRTRSLLLTTAALEALGDLADHVAEVPIFVVEQSAMNDVIGFN